jgi:hypothetical protein
MKIDQFNLKTIIFIFGLFFLPIIIFLKPTNFYQLQFFDIFLILTTQIIFLFFIILISRIPKFFFKNFNWVNFLYLNSIFFFSLFYFKEILILFKFEDKNFQYYDNFLVILIYILFYFLISLLIQKNLRNIRKLFFILILLNCSIFILQHSIWHINILNKKNYTLKEDFKIKNDPINFKNIKKSINQNNIFIIALDGMISLDKAEKLKMIKNSQYYISEFKRHNFSYNSNFFSNYASTYLSLNTLLESIYPTTEYSKNYKSRKNFGLSNLDNNFDKSNIKIIIENLNKNFLWIGNKWKDCYDIKSNTTIQCLQSNYIFKILRKIDFFYSNHLVIYFFDYLWKFDKKINGIDFLLNHKILEKIKKNYNSNLINFVHVYKPHAPYQFDKKCKFQKLSETYANSGKEEINLYGNEYRCILKNLTSIMSKFDDNDLVVFLGDHGWYFNEEIKNNYSNKIKNLRYTNDDFVKDRLNNVFMAIKFPKSCNNLKVPKSTVNIMRFMLSCDQKIKFDYLQDFKYLTRFEDHKDFGTTKKFDN